MTLGGVFYRIVVPTDFSTSAEEAWALAQRLADAFGSELVLVHVLVEAPLFEEGPFSMDRTRKVYEAARKWAEERLEEWAGPARRSGADRDPRPRRHRPRASRERDRSRRQAGAMPSLDGTRTGLTSSRDHAPTGRGAPRRREELDDAGADHGAGGLPGRVGARADAAARDPSPARGRRRPAQRHRLQP